jgi:hypothetical protein
VYVPFGNPENVKFPALSAVAVMLAAPLSANVAPLPPVAAGLIAPEIPKPDVLKPWPPLCPLLLFESVELTW